MCCRSRNRAICHLLFGFLFLNFFWQKIYTCRGETQLDQVWWTGPTWGFLSRLSFWGTQGNHCLFETSICRNSTQIDTWLDMSWLAPEVIWLDPNCILKHRWDLLRCWWSSSLAWSWTITTTIITYHHAPILSYPIISYPMNHPHEHTYIIKFV